MSRAQSSSERGFSLIELLMAILILMIGLAGILGMFTVAAGQNANQGESATRTTEYSQDKLEQLLALNYSDSTTDTSVYPAAATGGTGLGGDMAASTTVGGTNTSSPTTGYVDYLSSSGALLTSSTGAFYIRVWSISTNAAATLKTITVVSKALKSVGSGAAPSTTLVCLKTKTS